jgi:hypothetical protein
VRKEEEKLDERENEEGRIEGKEVSRRKKEQRRE